MVGRNCYRLIGINNRVRHDDAVIANGDFGIGFAMQETIEGNEDICSQQGMDYFGAVRCYIVAGEL